MSIEGVDPPNGGELRRLNGTLTFTDGHTVSIVAGGMSGFGDGSGWDARAVHRSSALPGSRISPRKALRASR